MMLCTVVVNMHIKAQTITEMPNSFRVSGNLIVSIPSIGAMNAPTAGQTKTMVNASTLTWIYSDSTGRIYDPGGPSGNYLSNLTATAIVGNYYNDAYNGVELTIEAIQLGTGDSLIVFSIDPNLPMNPDKKLLAVGNGYSTTGKWTFNSPGIYITFKSNSDANNGSGFSLLFRRLYNNPSLLPAFNGYSGNALLFNTKNGSLRSGLISNSNAGEYSAAMGYASIASGFISYATGNGSKASGSNSTAMGYASTASGSNSTAMGNVATASGYMSTAMGNHTTANSEASTAMGNETTAGGDYSTAMGDNTNASGTFSTAMGKNTTADGTASTAMGSNTMASGTYSLAAGYDTYAIGTASTSLGTETYALSDNSLATGFHTIALGNNTTAIGSYVSTNGKTGAIAIGDNSTTTVMYSATSNSFRARFASGYRFYTSSDLTTNCLLAGGDNAWSTTSDRRTKENLAEIEGEDFLKKIAGMQLTSWNYKSQDAKVRHYGPMAQDFFAAFGKDKYGIIGTDTTINSADFDGINLIAIQALEKRTTQMKNEEQESIKALQKQIEEMRALLLQQGKEIEDLKKMKDPCNSIVSIK